MTLAEEGIEDGLVRGICRTLKTVGYDSATTAVIQRLLLLVESCMWIGFGALRLTLLRSARVDTRVNGHGKGTEKE